MFSTSTHLKLYNEIWFSTPPFSCRSASTEKEKGEQELKKKKVDTHTFSDWTVLQKVLVAMEVEQDEFMFRFYFSESGKGGGIF